MGPSERARILHRIAVAERRLARGVDERIEARGAVRESEIRAGLVSILLAHALGPVALTVLTPPSERWFDVTATH